MLQEKQLERFVDTVFSTAIPTGDFLLPSKLDHDYPRAESK